MTDKMITPTHTNGAQFAVPVVTGKDVGKQQNTMMKIEYIKANPLIHTP